MNRRVIGIFLVLLLLGLGAGYALADATADEATAFDRPLPVPASSPEYPAGRLVIEADPADPPLGTGLELVSDIKGNVGFGVQVPRPAGWARTDPDTTEAKWTPVGLSDNFNTYMVRIKLIANQHLNVSQARDSRLQAVREVTDDFQLERVTDDTFTANYVTADHRRLAMERFLSLDGTEDPGDGAYLTIVVVGRMVDRDGLEELLDRVTAEAVLRRDLASD